MQVKELLDVLFNIEVVRICKAGDPVIWSGYAVSTPKKYYNADIDKVCSFPFGDLNSCTCIFIK